MSYHHSSLFSKKSDAEKNAPCADFEMHSLDHDFLERFLELEIKKGTILESVGSGVKRRVTQVLNHEGTTCPKAILTEIISGESRNPNKLHFTVREVAIGFHKHAFRVLVERVLREY